MKRLIDPEHAATLRRVVEVFRSTIYPLPLASPVSDAALDAALAALDAQVPPPSVEQAVFAAEFVRSLGEERRLGKPPNRRRAFVAAAEAVVDLQAISSERFVLDAPTLAALGRVLG